MQIGFHISIAKGFKETRREARRLGCEVIQVFLKNPRSWKTKVWSDDDRETFRELLGEIPVFAHLTYLPNLARIDENEQNMKGFVHELGLCVDMGLTSMVIHCGANPDKAAGITAVAAAVNLATLEYGIDIFIENSAGQGYSLGSSLEELSMIYEKINARERVSLCIDTAHLFASGYDIRTPESWESVSSRIGDLIGLDKIGFFHLNDSRTGLGSRIDRHWHIGKGAIGTDGFKVILDDLRFKNLKGVMETPKTDNMDEENMKVMRSLLSPLVPCPSS